MKLRHSAHYPHCLAVATVLGATRIALAGATPPIVRVYVAGPPEAVAGARDAVQDLCARSNVAVVVRDAAGADEALLATEHAPGLAEAYVDLRPGLPNRVVVVDGETRQDLERRTLPEGSSLEISIETVARVVCSAVESSLAARAVAATPVAAPSVAAPVQATRTAAPERADRGAAWASRISLFGAVEDFGAGFHGGAGAALGVSHGRSELRAGALLSVADYASADVEQATALASFGLFGARLLAMLEWRASSDVTAFVGLGGGGDWTRISAERAPLGGASNANSATFDAIGSGMLGTRLRLAGGLSALLALDADVDLTRHRYVIASPDSSRSFFEPARVRPVALAGLSWSFGGSRTEESAAQVEERR